MAARVPGRRRRLFRVCFRGMCTGLLLLVLFLVAFFIYLNEVGLPDFLKTALIERLQAKGLELEFKRLRLHWNRGVVAEDVRCGRARQETSGPQFTAREVELKIDHGALVRLRLNVNSVIVHDGKLFWRLDESNQPPAALTITNIQTQVRFLTNDEWELDHLVGEFDGAKVQLSGWLANAHAVRDWSLFQGKGGGAPGLGIVRLRRFVRTFEQVKFSEQPLLEVRLTGDALNLESFNGLLTLKAPQADTPWGTLTNGVVVSRLKGVNATNAAPRGDFELHADGADTLWGKTMNFRLHVSAAMDDSATNLVHARMEMSAAEFRTEWVDATQARFVAEWTHSITNAIPLGGAGNLSLSDVHTRWGTVGELRLDGKLNTSPANAPPQAGEQWAWWGKLEPYFIDWNCHLRNIHAEDKAQKFDLEELACGGNWRAPELTITNLHAEMYGGQITAGGDVDVATRVLMFKIASDFDAQKVSPFLTEGGQHWLQQFSWEKPPFVSGGGSVVLPAWTNRHPDWRGEVLPTLMLQGEFNVGNAAYRGVPVISAQSHVGFTNQTWTLPDLVAARPEGKIELVHMSDDLTKRFYFRVHSTIDVKAARDLLQPAQQRGMDFFEFTQPPLIDAEVWGRWHQPEQTGLRAHVVVSNFTFRSESASYLHGDIEYTNQFLTMTDGRIERGERFASASNLVLDVKGKRIFLTNGFSTIEPAVVTHAIGPKVEQVMAPYQFLQPPTAHVNGTIPLAEGVPADLHFKLEGGPFHWMMFNLDQIAGGVDWVGDHLALTDMKASFYGGKLTGTAAFDFKHNAGTEFSFDAIVTESNLRALMADLSAKSNQLEGKLNGHLNVTQANTREPKSWFGLGQVDLKDGLIWEIPIFGIFSPILDGISPGLGKSRASEAAGTFEITNSVIHSGDLEIKSPAMRMLYRGSVEFDGKVDAVVEARLLRDTWLVGPVLSTMLAPLTKLFEYKVTGSLGAPKMEPLLLVPKMILAPFHALHSIFSSEPKPSDLSPLPEPKKKP